MAYKAFISFKNTAPGGGQTTDYTIAKKLHSKLISEGMEVFFSEKDLSTAAFMDEIYQALDEAQLLILVGSSVEYINSKWVKSEWQNFFGAINSGKKPGGQIITVLDGISTKELPIQLSNLQSFDAADLDAAVSFAFKTLGMVKKSEIQQRLAEEAARKEREAEEARLLEARKQMEAELRAQREHQRAERRRERELKAADAARKRRERAEQRAAQKEAQKAAQEAASNASKVSADGKRGIIAAVLCLALVIGVAVWGAGYLGRQEKMIQEKTDSEKTEEKVLPPTDWQEDGFEFKHYGTPYMSLGYYAVTGYSGEGGNVAIPEMCNGIPVSVISYSAFGGCLKLTSITIPDSVTFIGENAFYRCTNLKSITIPNSVTIIGDWAFTDCTSLESITLPNSITSIGENAFGGCTRLTSINIPEGVTRIRDLTFNICTSLSSITIPDSVTSVGEDAFGSCRITVTAPHDASYYGYKPSRGVSWKTKE